MKILNLFITTILVVSAGTSTIAQMQTPTPKIKKIVVTGSAEMEVDPNEIYVNFILSEYYNNRKEKVEIDKIKTDFLAACEKSGITKEQIRVEGMAGSGYQNWYVRKRKKEADFIATVTYIIKFSDTKSIDALIPKLSDDAVTNMYISKFSHTRLEEFRKEIKIKSLQAARDKAKYLSESVGEKLGGALLIEEIDNGGSYPMMYRNANVMMDAAASSAPYGGETSMPFEKITIKFETRVEYEIL